MPRARRRVRSARVCGSRRASAELPKVCVQAERTLLLAHADGGDDELQVLASNYGISQPPLNTGTINKWYYHLEPRRYSLSMTVGF